MSFDTVPLDCSCGTLNEVPFEETSVSHTRACVACGADLHWRQCDDCRTGSVVPAADAPCRECAPVDAAAVKPVYRPWWPFAVWCPWCKLQFNYLRGMRESGLFECPHCRKWSEGSDTKAVMILIFVAMLGWALLGREVMDAFRPLVSHDVLGMIGVGFAMIFMVGALTVLGQTTQLTRHQPERSRKRRR